MRGRNLIWVLAWMLLLSCRYKPNSPDAEAAGCAETLEASGSATSESSEDEGESDGHVEGPGEGEGEGEPPEIPVLELNLSQVKQFDFEWMPALGAEYYQLLESIDVGGPYVQVGEDMLDLATSLTVPLHFRLNASYKLRACNHVGCTESEAVDVEGPLVEAIGYFKASNADADDEFGNSVALSSDGNTLAVGAWREGGSAIGIGGNQADNLMNDAGAVYVFVRDSQRTWSQQAYVKASNSDADDWFGVGVALSGDGNTLAVSASREDSSAMGVGGNQADNSFGGAGAVYVFVRDGQNTWSQHAYVKASNPASDNHFGDSVALSGDGNTLAVSALYEDSGAMGIGGNQADNSLSEVGAVYVFVRGGPNTWWQQAYIKASNPDSDDYFGTSVALSGDGNTLAVSALNEDSSATGIGGNQANNSALDAGAVYVFVRDGQDTWSQHAYIKASNADPYDWFGYSVALSGDGNILAVGAYKEGSSAMGIGGNQADDSVSEAGAAYVFVRDDQSTWWQQAYVKASNPSSGDHFGCSVALSGDGNTLAVSARHEASSAMGIGDNQADNSSPSGAVYMFVRDGQNTWSQRAYVKASNPDPGDWFGYSVALSDDGNSLAVGAEGEASSAVGIGGNQTDNSAPNAGAVYLY